MMHVAVIIPALNEAGNVTRLIAQLRSVSAHLPDIDVKIVVVDNGSTDGTGDEARKAGADAVIAEPHRGYGYACAAGVAAVGQLKPAADVIAFLDGDGSFDPAELPRLLAPIAENRADLVLGSRVLGKIERGAMPPHQAFGNRLVSRLMGLLYRLPITDLGPYRAIRRELLLSLHMREMTFGWPTEMIVKAARSHARIVEVPITYCKRWSGRSKVSGTLRGTLLATYFILGTTLRYAFGRWRDS
ncbi:MAG: glycosyltransferase family 2 protein [Aggregatilineales bacterium]